MQLFPSVGCRSAFFWFDINLPYLIAMFKRGVDVWIVHVSLNSDDAIIKDWLSFNIQDISHLRSYDKAQVL